MGDAMTIEQVRKVHEAIPFQPFTLLTADGNQFDVPHRDFLSQSPAGRTVIVYGEGDDFNIQDVLMITGIEVHQEKRSKSDN
jgi:hypothetical protein